VTLIEIICSPFGACWKEKQTISLAKSRSGSLLPPLLEISCSDSRMLILSRGSCSCHVGCMRIFREKEGNSRQDLRWLEGWSAEVIFRFSKATTWLASITGQGSSQADRTDFVRPLGCYIKESMTALRERPERFEVPQELTGLLSRQQ
jgi:hypothetical protein